MMTLDIPQANGLETVRRVVKAIALGATTVDAVADFTTYSTRHTGYRLHAARILGLFHSGVDLARSEAVSIDNDASIRFYAPVKIIGRITDFHTAKMMLLI